MSTATRQRQTPDQIVTALQQANCALADLLLIGYERNDRDLLDLIRHAATANGDVIRQLWPSELEIELGRGLSGLVKAPSPEQRKDVGREHGRALARQKGHRLGRWRVAQASAAIGCDVALLATCQTCGSIASVIGKPGRSIEYGGALDVGCDGTW